MTSSPRHLTTGGFAAIVVVYLVIVQGLGLLLSMGSDADYASFPDLDATLRGLTLPVGASVLFVIGVVSWLRWWPRVTVDDVGVPRWLWIVPIVMLGSAVVVTDYSKLGDIDGGLLLAVAIGSLLVGTGEELMFRGVGVNALRQRGLSEPKVALWSSVIFGAAHITNIVTEGTGAIIQVFVVSVSGFFFYLCLRVSGSIVLPILVHAAWDFSLFSHTVGDPDPSPRAAQSIAIVSQLVLVVVLVVRRRHLHLAGTDEAGTATVAS